MSLRRTRLKPGIKGLKTRTKLHAKKPLERKKPLARVSARRLASNPSKPKPACPAVPADVSAVIRKRSGGWCEIQRPGCYGRASDPCHRIGNKNGGRHGAAAERHHRPSNVLRGCRWCHDWCHDHPAEAKALGLMLEEWQIPTQEPVLYRGEMAYLTDDGRVLDYLVVGT